jgi:hypothetical protein
MFRERTGGDPLSDDEIMIAYLESDQLVERRSHPVERARLSHRATVGLWALRAFAIVLTAMVVYTFVAQLGS